MLVIDSKSYLIKSKKIHRHEQIDCDNCFAYVPDEICAHQLSDINIFAVCQVSEFTQILLFKKKNGYNDNDFFLLRRFLVETLPLSMRRGFCTQFQQN